MSRSSHKPPDLEDIQTFDEAKDYLLTWIDACIIHRTTRQPIVVQMPVFNVKTTTPWREGWQESRLVVQMVCPACSGFVRLTGVWKNVPYQPFQVRRRTLPRL